MLDQIKAFQVEAQKLGRDQNSVEEFKLWIESESQTKTAEDPEEYVDRASLMDAIKYQVEDMLETHFPDLTNLRVSMELDPLKTPNPFIKIEYTGR